MPILQAKKDMTVVEGSVPQAGDLRGGVQDLDSLVPSFLRLEDYQK